MTQIKEELRLAADSRPRLTLSASGTSRTMREQQYAAAQRSMGGARAAESDDDFRQLQEGRLERAPVLTCVNQRGELTKEM